MRFLAVLALPLVLTGCDSSDSSTRASVQGCSEKELNAKIEKYSQTAAKLVERDASAWDETEAERWAAMTAKMSDKSAELQKRALPLAGVSEKGFVEELCKGYDELQAIVDEAAAAKS